MPMSTSILIVNLPFHLCCYCSLPCWNVCHSSQCCFCCYRIHRFGRRLRRRTRCHLEHRLGTASCCCAKRTNTIGGYRCEKPWKIKEDRKRTRGFSLEETILLFSVQWSRAGNYIFWVFSCREKNKLLPHKTCLAVVSEYHWSKRNNYNDWWFSVLSTIYLRWNLVVLEDHVQ